MSKRAEPTVMYRIADLPPPYAVRVWLLWAGWLGIGGRGLVSGRERWFAWVDGRPVDLPPAAARYQTGGPMLGHERPELWAPTEPGKWQAGLPEPVSVPEPRMWSSRQAFNATEAAAEMEADREAARANAGDATRGQGRVRWWRDASQIRYSVPGSISKREAEGRVMRAIAGDPEQRFADGTGLHQRFLLRDFGIAEVRAIAEQEASRLPDFIVRFEPLPQDRTDEDVALGWFRDATRPARRVLRLAADDRGLSWSEISAALGIKRGAQARAAYEAAIDEIWTLANGFHHAGAAARATRHAALVAGNRAYKRREREGDL